MSYDEKFLGIVHVDVYLPERANLVFSMFSPDIKLEQLNALGEDNMQSHLGIEFTEIGKDYIKAKMPVDRRTIQPMGLLHGGASVVLAETMGSTAATLILDLSEEYPVGLEINANHIKSAKSGHVTGICRPIHIGGSTQIWEIRIYNDREDLTAISRLTVAVLKHKK